MALRRTAAAAAFASFALSGTTALAAPCAGFVDVDDANPGTSQFCTSVQWVKNRAITTGCPLANSYCPNDPVTRLAMAAFLFRLGKAIEPLFVHANDAGAATAVNAGAVVCQTPVRLFTVYPRVATGQGMLYHRATTQQLVTARLTYSVDGGLTWADWGALASRATNPAGGYASQSPVARATTFIPPASVIFGIRTGEAGAPAVDDAGCEIRVRWESRAGTFDPYDAEAADE